MPLHENAIHTPVRVVARDGKTLRRSYDRAVRPGGTTGRKEGHPCIWSMPGLRNKGWRWAKWPLLASPTR